MTHPLPEVPCVEVEPGSELVPPSARSAWRTASLAGWTGCLTYARGTTITSKGTPGGVVDTVALRLARGTKRAVAVWMAQARAVCPGCERDFLPLGTGVFRAHKAADGDTCPGSGQPAAARTAAATGKRKYAFDCAFTSGKAGWWNDAIPQRVDASHFLEYLKAE